MDFQQFMDIGEKLKLEGKELLSFVERELEKLRLKEEAIAAREEREAERHIAKDAAERQFAKDAVEAERQVAKDGAERQVAKDAAERQVAKDAVEAERQVAKGAAERQVAKDAAEAERQAAVAERQAAAAERMQHEKDMAVLHLEEDRVRAEQSNVSSREMNVSRTSLPKTPMLPRFKESEGSIDAYLVRFERYASNEGWSRDCYALYLSALLEGTALDVYHRLPDQEANDYDALKAALLRKYSLTVEDFRKKFYFSKQSASETASQLFSRLEHFFPQWIALSKIELNFDSLKELIRGEQFLHSCPRDLALFIRERTPTDVSEMMKLATVYTDSRVAAGMRQDKTMAPPSMSKPP